jgi:hypothetical protein
LKSVATEKDHHTRKYITNELNEIVSKIGSQNIIAITINNTSNMKSSWQNVQQQYSKILCLSCSPYMINLFVKNIMKLPVLHNYFEIVREINQYWKNSDVLIELLQSVARESNQELAALQLL